MSEYSNYFKDPRWQKKRLEILERDKFTCQMCQDDKETLNVHHMYYEPEKKPWEYSEDSLITLCEGCHETETEFIKEGISLVSSELRKLFFSEHLFWLFSALSKVDKKTNKSELLSRIIKALKNGESSN